MYVCDRCGKGLLVGMNVSHSHRRTKKRSRPNLHKTTLTIRGRRQSMRLCTKCLRLTKKEATIVQEKSVAGEVQTSNKIEKTGTLSEAIQKAASKKTEEGKAETLHSKPSVTKESKKKTVKV